jgi:hypothetical protein
MINRSHSINPPPNNPKSSTQTRAIQELIRQEHTILIGQEHLGGSRSFHSFSCLKSLWGWMTTWSDAFRNLYHVDLSAAVTTTQVDVALSSKERAYMKNFVSPLVFDVEWMSSDNQPDPLSAQRIEVLKSVVFESLQKHRLLSETCESLNDLRIEVEYLGRNPQGKKAFKNSYHIVLPDVVFDHNSKGCMSDFVKLVLWPEFENRKEWLWTQTLHSLVQTECIVDKVIYSRTRQMRMPGCCKFGGIGLPVATLEELQRMRTSYFLPELPQTTTTNIITEAMVSQMIPFVSLPPPLAKRCRDDSSSTTVPLKRVKRVVGYSPNNQCAELVEMLKAHGDYTSTVETTTNGGSDTYLVKSPNAKIVPRVCVCDPTGQTTHASNSGKIAINKETGQVWFYCHSVRCENAICIGEIEFGARSDSKIVMDNEDPEEEEMEEKEEHPSMQLPMSLFHSSINTITTTAAAIQNHWAAQLLRKLRETQRSLVAQRKVITISTNLTRINDDPKFNVTTLEGKALYDTWKGSIVTVDTPQGTGKSYWFDQIVIYLLKENPLGRIVYLVPFTTLTIATTARLIKAIQEARQVGFLPPGQKIIVKQYQDKDKVADWNVLVCHQRSLKNWCLHDVTTLLIDEATAMSDQTVEWKSADDKTRESVNGSAEMIKQLCKQADWIAISCAQLTPETREWIVSGVELPLDSVVLRYTHGTTGRQTPVVTLLCDNVLRAKIWADVLAGHRLAVSVRYATDAKKMNEWLGMMVEQHNKNNNNAARTNDPMFLCVPSVAWTAKWCQGRNDSPASDVTQWLTQHKIQVVFYTNSLSPGMSVDHEHGYWHRVYMHIGNQGSGANSTVMGQMARRFRDPGDTTLYMYVQPVKGAIVKDHEEIHPAIAGTAMRAIFAEHPASSELIIDSSGIAVSVLKRESLNDQRFQARYKQVVYGNVIHAVYVIKKMGGAELLHENTDTQKPDDMWVKVQEAAKERIMLQTIHMTNDELPKVYEATPDEPLPAAELRACNFNHIANTVPPEFVTNVQYRHAHSLTSEAFSYIHDKYQQLRVVQELATLHVDKMIHTVKLRESANAKQTQAGPAAYGMLGVERAVAAICSLVVLVNASNGGDITAIAPMVGIPTVTLKHAESDVIYPVLDNFVVTDKQAYGWVKDNWSMIQAMSSRRLPLNRVVPNLRDTVQWQMCLQYVLKEQAGISWRKRKNKPSFEMKGLSLWTKLGINVEQYADWYRTPGRETRFGIVKRSIQSCTECNGTGDEVMCVRQANLWRCDFGGSDSSHREVFEPLDVNSIWELEIEEVDEEQKQVKNKSAIDMLLGHLGFTTGARVDGFGVSKKDMKLAWSRAVVTSDNIDDLLALYKVDIKPTLMNRTNIQKILEHVATILQTSHLKLEVKHYRVAGKPQRRYHVTTFNE